MPNLLTSLTKFDLGHLRIIATMWGIELESKLLNCSPLMLAQR